LVRVDFRRLDVLITQPGSPPAETARVLLCWEIIPIHTSVERTVFAVERSLEPSFAPIETETIAAGIAAQPGQYVYSYVDVTPSLINHWRRYFYRIRATYDADTTWSAARSWEKAPRIYELAIIERHDLLLHYETGAPTFAFVERTAGSAACSECYDRTAGRPSKSGCLHCLGTGRERPYFDPILLWVDYNPGAHLIQIAALGELQTKQRNCWFSAYPILKPGDILYQVGAGDLYRIARIGPNAEPQGVTILQVAALDALDRSSVEYRGLPQKIAESDLLEVVAEWEQIRRGGGARGQCRARPLGRNAAAGTHRPRCGPARRRGASSHTSGGGGQPSRHR
jgi:hypothetical protein